jgi:hypothetical protein
MGTRMRCATHLLGRSAVRVPDGGRVQPQRRRQLHQLRRLLHAHLLGWVVGRGGQDTHLRLCDAALSFSLILSLCTRDGQSMMLCYRRTSGHWSVAIRNSVYMVVMIRRCSAYSTSYFAVTAYLVSR